MLIGKLKIDDKVVGGKGRIGGIGTHQKSLCHRQSMNQIPIPVIVNIVAMGDSALSHKSLDPPVPLVEVVCGCVWARDIYAQPRKP